MESANLHHHLHQLQDQLVESSSLATPSWFGVETNHAWTPNLNNLNSTDNINQNVHGELIDSSRDSRHEIDMSIHPMIQDSGFHWSTNAARFITTSHSAHDQHLAKIKEELTNSFPKFTDMITDSSHSSTTEEDLSEKLFFKTISSGGGFLSDHSQNSCSSFGSVAMPSRVMNYSQIFPSINISNLNESSSPPISNALGFHMNLQALDFLTSTRLSGSINHPAHDNDSIVKESLSFGPDHHMQHLTPRSSSNHNKLSPFINGVSETKRSGSYMEPKASQPAPKKSRSEPRSSCPPFKVRKEKLGDRISALQQLVAPFGKTDTASVLMEAIGYIKFLQNQVETLSVPYMKSARNRTCRMNQMGQIDENGNQVPKPDLRSRGLCLVPLSCMSYITNDGSGGGGGGGIWPPIDHYRGGT